MRQMIDIEGILKDTEKPNLFAPAGQPIWTDPHVSKQLLIAHLDPNTDAASRRPAMIDRSVAWFVDLLKLKPGTAIIDLGCGPGLYSQRLAKLGMQVTGIDFSQESITYARKQALIDELQINYRLQNYLELDEPEAFEVALLIYGDYCVLCPSDRKRLLTNVRRLLKPGGKYVVDVTTRSCRRKHGLKNGWHAGESGFWSERPHIVLEQGFDYPEELVYLDQYIVMEESGSIRIFRNWFQDFTVDMIVEELKSGGFDVIGTYGDLFGNPCSEDSDWIGVVAEKLSSKEKRGLTNR